MKQEMRPELEAASLDGVITTLETWRDIKNTCLLDFSAKSTDTLRKYRKHCTNFFLSHITLEPLNGKTSFQAHIVEQHKSYIGW